MTCHVYRSESRPDTYVWLRERDAFALLPPALAQRLGTLVHVMQLELEPGRRLARADASVVLVNLAEHGFHLQLPPSPELAGPVR